MNGNDPFARLPEAASFTVTGTTVAEGAALRPEQMSGHTLGRAVLTATAETPS